MKPTFFASGAEFRAWLEKHHDTATELVMGFYKNDRSPKGSRSNDSPSRSSDSSKGSRSSDSPSRSSDSPKGSRSNSSREGSRSTSHGARGFSRAALDRRGMTYQEALDEALAFGWIDGVRRSIDDTRWSIRFTPRKPRSIWSNVNVRHVKRLIAEQRMTPAGMRAYAARSEQRSGVYGYERRPMTFDPAAKKAFAAAKKAKAYFDAQPPGYRRIVTYWVMSAKREETRARRLAWLIQKSGRGERIDLMKPNE